MIILAAIALVTFHTPDGRLVQVNPMAVQALIYPNEPRHKMIVQGAHCVIGMGAKYISVTETCEEAKRMLEGGGP